MERSQQDVDFCQKVTAAIEFLFDFEKSMLGLIQNIQGELLKLLV